MKKFNIYLFSIFFSIFVSSCGSVKEGFSSQKKNNSDEFLVEKKSPLLMPQIITNYQYPIQKIQMKIKKMIR
tara:strand:+ start:215 stop:430 length:216 start_codon:yes stop_codon:yes gene_type:complete